MAQETTAESMWERLKGWPQSGGSLPQSPELYKRLLQIEAEAKARFAIPEQPRSQAAQRLLGRGTPLLKWGAFFLDWPLFQKTLQRAIAVLGEHAQAEPGTLSRLGDLAADTSRLQEMARAWYQGASLSPWARSSAEEDLMAAAWHHALRPFLCAHAEALLGLVEQQAWRRGYCPICGARPDLGFLEKQYGARWLLCSRCDAQWLFQRLECPYCSNSNPGALAYFTDDQAVYRLYVCDRCRTYLKVIDLRRAEGETPLPLERVLTSDLDRQGREQGYEPGHLYQHLSHQY